MTGNDESQPASARSDSIGYLVRSTFRAFTRSLEKRLAAHDISISMWFFLRLLWEGDGRSQKEISDELGLTQPTTVAAIDNLERRGLVIRQRDSDDRRKSNIFLTEAGRALRQNLIGFADQVNHVALRGMSEREKAEFKSFLIRTIQALGQDPF